MKKVLFLLTAMVLFFTPYIFAKHIDEATAKRVGQHFLMTKSEFKNASSLRVVYKVFGNTGALNPAEQLPLFYVFGADAKGFVIVSADDNVFPILAYSCASAFESENMPIQVQKWLEDYKKQISYVIDNQIEATEEIKSQWATYMAAEAPQGRAKNANSVNPLIQTRWGQSPYYNALCPSNSVTGCVATAMAQVMKYWNFPTKGRGFHSYNHQVYGTLSANFGNTTYQWASMPNSVSSSNNAVATLMYHCGVSVDMNYSPQSSGAYVIESYSATQYCAEYALKTYFGYKGTLRGVERQNYTQSQWTNLLRTELDAGRPIVYSGFGSGGGHAFVCDGYDANDYFHFNWGWDGYYDGFFWINNLNPTGVGTGGGSGGYNSSHQAIIGVEPPSANQTSDIVLYNFVSPSASSVSYSGSFSISTNIANVGTNTFSGDYCAAIFDNQSNFVDYVQIISGQTLQGGYSYPSNLTFTNSGSLSILPGSYHVGIYYRPTGGNWTLVSDYSNYVNWIPLTVVSPNSIQLNSAINIAQGSTLVQGQAMSASVNIANTGSTLFTGQYQLNLYKPDGTFAQTINTITESNGLPAGYTYPSPYLTFSTNALNVAPGTYILAVIHKSNSSTNWEWTGATYYQNPIKITVQSSALSPDVYETNNTLAQAYTLPSNFSNNAAAANTTGANLHTNSDNDYYKINLPQGYDYTIAARLHDSYNSGNGNTYTVDGLFSYSTDGSTWSSTYDDVMSSNIIVRNGGTLYFHVAPYFAGSTGTYLLQTNITRTQASVSVQTTEPVAPISVYPNPAKDFVIINCGEWADKVTAVEITNAQGQQIELTHTNHKQLIQLPLQGLASGIYTARIHTTNQIISKQFVVGQ